jgi:drug/metabolite transporter (DMT)-like permease
MSPPPEAAGTRRAIALVMLALTCLILLDASGKWLGGRGVPVAATTWSRYLGHLLLILAIFLPAHGASIFVTRHPVRQLVRGALMVLVTLLYFVALKAMPLAQATAVFFMTPILVTLFSTLYLRERPGWPTWLAIGCGFAGVLIVVRPGTDLPLTGVLLTLAAAACNAAYQTLTRAQAQADAPQVQVLYAGLVGAVIMTASLPWWWAPRWWAPLSLTPLDWLVFGAAGVLGGLGHLLLVRAYRLAQASRLAPWMYTQLLLSVTIGFLVFGDAPDVAALAGMALIAASPNLVNLRRR